MNEFSEKCEDMKRKSSCRWESCMGRLRVRGSPRVEEYDVLFGCAGLRYGVLGVYTVIDET
jgi:hypothetical protein